MDVAIFVYRLPITSAQVYAVPGVDSSGVTRPLLGSDMIVESGRLETVGRPILYATTSEFLRQFGLSSLAELPPLDLPMADPALRNPDAAPRAAGHGPAAGPSTSSGAASGTAGRRESGRWDEGDRRP